MLHQPDFLEHVAVVVEAGLVDAEGNRDAAPHKFGDRRDAAPEAEVGAGIVTDADAVLPDEVEVTVVHPGPVPQRQVRTEESDLGQVCDRRLAEPPARELLLVGRLRKVKVNAHAVFPCPFCGQRQETVGGALEIDRRKPEPHQRVGGNAAQMIEHGAEEFAFEVLQPEVGALEEC